jgi:3-(3-hydroxy-phenyl)propionate hydroxylase
MKYDVIISGLGPVGAALAALLGHEGIRVAVVERHPTIFDKPRAIVLDHEALRLLQFCRINPQFYDGISPHPGTDFLGVDGKLIKLFDPMPAPYPLGWPATVTFLQPKLEAALRDELARCKSVDVFLGEEVTGLSQDSGSVTVMTSEAQSGRATELTGRWLVGCDGANSLVRKGIGSDLDDQSFNEWWLVVDAWLVREADLPRKVTQYCRPSRPGTLVIGPNNLRRWEIKLLPGELPGDFVDKAAIKKVLSTFVDVDAIDIWRSAVYNFDARIAKDWQRDRVFIAGDAAHQTPPFLGQGLCAGLRDAANLGWKLIQVLKYQASPELLRTYREERYRHTETVIRHAKEFGLIIGELDEQRARKRDCELRTALHNGTMKTIRQDFIPGLETGIIDSAKTPPAGTLFIQPQVVTSEGKSALLDDILQPRFLIVGVEAEVMDWMDADAIRAWTAIGGERVVLSGSDTPLAHQLPDAVYLLDARGDLTAWLKKCDGRVAIVRPDRYVYGVAKNAQDLNRMLADVTKSLH